MIHNQKYNPKQRGGEDKIAFGIALSELGMTLGAFAAYLQLIKLSYCMFGLWIIGIVIFMLGYKYR